MSSIHFTDAVTHVPAHWANDVDALVYDVFEGSQNKLQAMMALGVGTLGYQNANNVQIAGGDINNTVIGYAQPASAKFTNVVIEAPPNQPYHVPNKKYVDGRIDDVQLLVNSLNTNRYGSMVVDGTPVPALSSNDAFTIEAGTNISLTANPLTRTMTIEASLAGGSGNVVTNSQAENIPGSWLPVWVGETELGASAFFVNGDCIALGRTGGVSPLQAGSSIDIQWGSLNTQDTVHNVYGVILGGMSSKIGNGGSSNFCTIVNSQGCEIADDVANAILVGSNQCTIGNTTASPLAMVFHGPGDSNTLVNVSRTFVGAMDNLVVGWTSANVNKAFLGCGASNNVANTGGPCETVALVAGSDNFILNATDSGIFVGNNNTVSGIGVGVLFGYSNNLFGNNVAVLSGWDSTIQVDRTVVVNANWVDFATDVTNPDIERATVLLGTHVRQRVTNATYLGSTWANGFDQPSETSRTAQVISFVAGAVTVNDTVNLTSDNNPLSQAGVYAFPEGTGSAGFDLTVTATDDDGYYEVWKVTGVLYRQYIGAEAVAYTITPQGANPRGDWSIDVLDPSMAPFFGLHVQVGSAGGQTIWTAHFNIVENTRDEAIPA